MPAEYMHHVVLRHNLWRVSAGSTTIELRDSQVGSSDEHEALRQHAAVTKAWHALTPQQQAEYSLDVWRAAAETVHERGWSGYAVTTGGEVERIEIDTSRGVWAGMPVEAVTRQLNGAAQEGWRVVSVTEDKGLYLGADARDESYPARVRYLLERTVPAADRDNGA